MMRAVKILISGVCGFVGSTVARTLRALHPDWEIRGLDNLSRPGSEINRRALAAEGVAVAHADVRVPSDLEGWRDVAWVIDAAANPSVLAGVGAGASPRQLLDHNLGGTMNLLEFCRERRAGFILLSTSRVYSIRALSSLPVVERGRGYTLDTAAPLPPGASAEGVSEEFDTRPPVSLYGTTKRCSELLALEYAGAFDMPVWINRCGVMAGAGQFGKPDQGIFAYWIHAWARKRPLRFIGFGGTGFQARDVLHPSDLARLLAKQMAEPGRRAPRIANVSGGAASAISLAQLSDWCAARFGPHPVEAVAENRPFDIPWAVLDSSAAREAWDWKPEISRDEVLEGIAAHAAKHPDWLEISGA